jgi:hypothetical protein
VAEIHSSPPYCSKNGQMIESIIEELNGFRGAKFVHVNKECNTVIHVLAKKAANQRLSKCWRQEAPNYIYSTIITEHICP